ncbi:MAG: hypothetical protein DRJ29_17205 [Bacteroidetes bacterium]|nr:MAG: hypothetical protein DRJ29_17205 [Bacteroidota bacterium]
MTRKVLHIVVAVFILISSTGFTINMHYCHDQLIDLAFLAPAHSCCDSEKDDAIQSQDSCPGCQDESIVVEPGDDFEVSSSTCKFENAHNTTLFLTSAVLHSIQSIDESTKNEVPWYKKPPPYQEVILSQIQSYLI